jgi:threonine synthase
VTPSAWPGVIATYRRYLPVTDRTPIVTLGEGNTPLLPAPRLAEATDPNVSVYLKCEGVNPTGSFKDRGMTLAISKAVEAGSRAVICVSTGNTSASAAAFAARAGLRAFVIVPKGAIALGKLSQAAIHGAKILTVDATFDQALAIVGRIAETHPVTLVNSANPFRLDGQKTAAFEVVDQLGRAPDYHLIPVGNPGNIAASWRGYREYHRDGRMKQLPRMVGLQPAGAAALSDNRVLEQPRTVASTVKTGSPAARDEALAAMTDSHGWVDVVTDEEIRRAYRLLARDEGVFVEPAAAATVAGLVKSVKAGRLEPGSTVVLTLTGHGLKDPDAALESATRPTSVPASIDAVLAQLGL